MQQKKEIGELNLSSQSMFHSIKDSQDTRTLKRFLECVAHGEQDKAEALLQSGNPSKWLLGVEEFTDPSRRTFRCSAYEYAYWAKDTHMRRMLEKYMDGTTSATILRRINKLEGIDDATGKATGKERGLHYKQNSTIRHTAHFDFTQLIQAQRAFLEFISSLPESVTRDKFDALKAAWLAIGEAQLHVPAHVANEYCRPDRSFSPCPQFNEPTLPRVLTIYRDYEQYDSWFPLTSSDSGLGFNYSITRGSCPLGRGDKNLVARLDVWRAALLVNLDLAAIDSLDIVRTTELEESRDHLNTLANSLTWLSPKIEPYKKRRVTKSETYLSRLPRPLIRYLSTGSLSNSDSTGFLTIKEIVQFGLSSKSMLHATKDSRDSRILKKFLLCVARGEQDKAEVLLKIKHGTPSKWLLGVEEFTDYSGRTFKCSAYEYAYWAKDTHMRNMLEKYMDNATSTCILERINKMEQIDKSTGQKRGLTYRQHGKLHSSAHFDFTSLIKALKERAEACNFGWMKTNNLDAIVAASSAIAKAQRDVPAHVANEYCRPDRSFYPCPQFNEPTLPRVLTVHHPLYNLDGNWFSPASPYTGLGLNFLVNRGHALSAGMDRPASPSAQGDYPIVDLKAIICLDKVRTAELAQSRDRLNTLANSLTWLSPVF